MEQNSAFLEKNINAVTRYKLYLLNLIEELDKEEYPYQGIITDIFLTSSAKGEKILGLQKEGHDYYLNSRYDSAAGVQRWTSVFNGNKIYGSVLIVGMANLEYIRGMRKIYPEVRLIVYEPDKYIWNELLMKTDMSDLIEDSLVNITVGKIGERYLKELLERTVDYANYKYLQMMISPNYDKIYQEACKTVRDIMYYRIEGIIVDRNTRFKFSSQYTWNRCVNTYDSLFQYNANDIRRVLDHIDFDITPAILVSAGPSLDKNISYLKEAKGKAFLIAVDAALRALVKENIIPDMAVTIDPGKWLQVLFEDERMKEIPLLISLDANGAASRFHRGKRFYFYGEFRFINEIWEKYGKNYLKLETAGSVANDAFSFVRRMGFKNIILIGQDLAYTGDKVHSDNSYGELRNNNVSTKGEVYVIKDIYGNDVKTDYAMDIYRRWFEDQIRLHKDIHVIDATEGGAMIEGAELMTLREAVERECKAEKQIDFVAAIHNTSPAYTETERLEIQEYISRVVSDMKGPVKKKLQEAKRAYLKLQELNIKRKYSGSTFSDTLRKVSGYNEWITSTVEVDMLSMYADRENYDVMENIYEQRENQYEDIKAIVDGGLKLIESYDKAADVFVAQMQSVIDQFTKKEQL